LVWLIFGALLFVTAVALALYNRYVVPRPPVQTAIT
jgi:hypothetical protein